MDPNVSAAPYEFLDLTDIDDNERKQLICTLYKTASIDKLSEHEIDRRDRRQQQQNPQPQQRHLHHYYQINRQQEQNIYYQSAAKALNDLAVVASSTSTSETSRSSQKFRKSSDHFLFTTNGAPATVKSTKDINKFARHEASSKYVNKNIASINLQSHVGTNNEKTSPLAQTHAVHNVVLPRLLAPITLPFCAVVKPALAEVAVVPLRTTTVSAAAKSVETLTSKLKVNQKTTNQQTSIMTQHNSSLHHSQQQQQTQSQVQQQGQQSAVVSGQQQQLMGASVQLQTSGQGAAQQNNNYQNNQQQPVHFAPLHSGGVFMPPPGHGPMYQVMQPSLPGNVYVNNVTANVNLHGYSVPSYMQQFIPGELPPNIQHGIEQGNQIIQPVTSNTTSTRGSRRGRGRGGNNNSRRNDYVQRQQASPTPQELMNTLDPQTMTPAGYAPFYPYYSQPIFTGPPPQGIGHPQAQQATGPPLYVAGPMPMYAASPQVFNYPGFIYNIAPPEYQLEENVEEQQPTERMLAPLWHPHMAGMEYPEEYLNPELVEDINNHNTASPMSSNTPSVISPILYEQTMDMQPQMTALHIYDASPLSRQPHHSAGLQSHDTTEHHHLHEQMVPIMHEQLMGNGQIALDEMQELMCEQQSQQMQLHLDPAILIQNRNEVDEIRVDECILQSEPLSVVPGSVCAHVVHDSNAIEIATVPKFVNNSNSNDAGVIVEQCVNNNNLAPIAVVVNSNINSLVADSSQNVPNVSLPPMHLDEESVASANITSMIMPQQQPPQKIQQTLEVHPQPHNHQHDIISIPQPAAIVDDLNIPAHDPIKNTAWTGQIKKHTASVAITATPVFVGKPVSSSKTVAVNANVNESQAVQQPIQVKSHGIMKTPSSPVATGDCAVEKKHNFPIFEPNKHVSTNSIASTAAPQQLQIENKLPSQQAHHSSTTESKKQQFHVQPQAFNFSHSTATSSSRPVETVARSRKEDIVPIVLPTPTPPVQAPQSQLGSSWASLFTNNGPAPGSVPSPVIPIPVAQPAIHQKKPIAKVLPFEGTSSSITQTPGSMSYSAASAQGLSSLHEQIVHSSKMKSSSSQQSVTSNSMNNNNNNNGNNALNISAKGNVEDWSNRFADFLTKYKIDFSPVSLRPRGLTNCSNYCYINAILQSLIGCPPFYNLIKSIPKLPPAVQMEKSNLKAINAMTQLVNEFSHLPPGARLQTNRRDKAQKKGDDLSTELTCDPAFTPHAIYKLWNDSRKDVGEGRQEDAEEFLGFVLNQINDEMLEIIKLIAKPTVEQNGDQNVEGDDGDDWQMIYNNRNKGSVTRQTDFGRTPLSDVFRGELRSRLQREGEHSTDDIQPFFTLQLNIEKAASVKEALEILVGRDQLEGVTCSKTNQEVNAWQQMTLEKLPVVLILHLKWFDYKPDGCTKILKTVEFPVELKIDTKILASKKYSQKQRLYKLFAVVYHDGKEASKGHYIADVFHVGYNSWLRYDDSSVKPVKDVSVLHPRAPRVPYLLYYRRCDTVSTPSNQQQQQPQQLHQPQQHHPQHNTNNNNKN